MSQRTVYIAFPLPTEQEERLYAFIKKVKESEDKKPYAAELAEVVAELVDISLDHYFWKPVQLLNLGTLTLKMIRMGLNSGKKTLSAVARKVIKGFDSDQVGKVIEFMESLILETE